MSMVNYAVAAAVTANSFVVFFFACAGWKSTSYPPTQAQATMSMECCSKTTTSGWPAMVNLC